MERLCCKKRKLRTTKNKITENIDQEQNNEVEFSDIQNDVSNQDENMNKIFFKSLQIICYLTGQIYLTPLFFRKLI